MTESVSNPPYTIIFIGCGHSTSLLLQALISHPPAFMLQNKDKFRYLMISDSPFAMYSGMVPGVCGKQYDVKEAMLAVKPFFEEFLTKVAGGKKYGAMICAKVERIDKERKEILARTRERENQFYWKGLEDEEESKIATFGGEETQVALIPPSRYFTVKYDSLMLNIGSQTRGSDILGKVKHLRNVLPTRPISHLPLKVEAYENVLKDEARPQAKKPIRIVVCGDGAAGYELCNVIYERFSKQFEEDEYDFQLTLIGSHESLADASGSGSLGKLLDAELKRKHVRHLKKSKATKVTRRNVTTDTKETLPYDMLVWAVGADPIPVGNGPSSVTQLKMHHGFFEVNRMLQSVDDASVFAVGDCAHLTHAPETPKAGVYSVRMAEPAKNNILTVMKALLKREKPAPEMKGMKEYEPQKGFLRIYNIGDGTAVSIWKGLTHHGRADWWLKNYIDTKFMNKFNAAKVKSEHQVKELCQNIHSDNYEEFIHWKEDNTMEQ